MMSMTLWASMARISMIGEIRTPDDLDRSDRRRHYPRFQGENFKANLALVEKAKGEHVVPIPGTKRRKYLEQNVGALDVALSKAELLEIDAVFPPEVAAGERYPASMMTTVEK
jgi:aryl-alcohol dehydrogenase-like predicted oxidoreductase